MTTPRRIVGSYTFFSELENCPKKAFEKRVRKSVQYIEGEAARWGNYVHDAMEQRISRGKSLQDDDNLAPLEKYAAVFDGYSAAGYDVVTERKMGVTADGQPTKFFGPECYVGGKIDVTVRLSNAHFDITDWKTGKDTYESPFELELHALLMAVSVAPLQAKYTARYAYIGRLNGEPDKLGQTYDVSNVGATWAKVNALMQRAYQFEQAGEWPATPNPLCGWCDVLWCPHNKTKQRLEKEGK